MTGAAATLVPRLRAAVARTLETVVVLLMAALAVVVVVAVTFRKAGAALVWYDEVAGILLAWITFYGSGLAALHQAHIGFPKLAQRLPPRARLIALIIRELAVLGFFLALAYAGWRVAAGLQGMYLVSLPAVSRSLSASAIPLGALGFVVAELLSVMQWKDSA